MLNQILAIVEAEADRSVERLVSYLRHKSISAWNEGIAEVAALLVAHLGELGFAAEAVATAGHPMVLGRREGPPGTPTVLLYGHYDVQPPDPVEAWVTPPFEPAIRDGRIYARGAGDNKGQHFAQLLAIETLLAATGSLPCGVIVLLEGEEEVGSPHIVQFVEQNRERLRADLVVTADGPLHASGLPIVTLGVRGVATFELRCRHANRDLHSGNFGGVVPNPLWTLVHLLATMRTPDGRITIDGLHDAILAPTPAESGAADALPSDEAALRADLGLARLDAPIERKLHDRLMFYPTLTINGLHGGYSGPGAKTVLPHEAFAKCDIRLVEAQTPEDVFAKVAAHVLLHAPEVEFFPLNGMLPSRTPIDAPFTGLVCQAVEAARGVAPLLYPCLGGSLPDYVFTKMLNIPAYVIPYANADEANHAPNENISIRCFIDGIRVGVALLHHLGTVKFRMADAGGDGQHERLGL